MIRSASEVLEYADINPIRRHNEYLIHRYPFLRPDKYDSVEEVEEAASRGEYKYDYTLLDDMPPGWRVAFGEEMCEELREALLAEEDADDPDSGEDALNTYRVLQIKEKFGYLHWYGSYASPRVYEVLDKYERLSEVTCISCGAVAEWMTTGWILPYCSECINKLDRSVERVSMRGDEKEEK